MIDKCSAIAKMAARDNLKRVNEQSRPVHPRNSFYAAHLKRIIDLIIVIPVFTALLPINLVLGIITFFDVGHPVFFKQKRTGKDGKTFDLVKFRNMTNAKDEFGNLLPPSQRVTKWGKFVRKYSLDELLNFWSILKGDMTIIGPRPLPSSFDERYSNRHKMRTAVKPGLECPSLEYNGKVRLYQEQFENDIWYVEHISFLTDIKLTIALFRMVLDSKERGDHAEVGGGDFVGYDENGVAFSMRRIPKKYEDEYQAMVAEWLKKNKETSYARTAQ